MASRGLECVAMFVLGIPAIRLFWSHKSAEQFHENEMMDVVYKVAGDSAEDARELSGVQGDKE